MIKDTGNNKFSVCIEKGGQRDQAESFARKTGCQIIDKPGKQLTVLFNEMLVRAAKSEKEGRKAIDATAGMGEDAFLLAAQGYEVTLYEQNPVIAVLLKDALRRAKKHPILKDIAGRMKLVEGNSVECMSKLLDPVDVIYLDPMFPARQKSSLINKKLQLIQKLEPPCSEETDLFDAAIKAGPNKIIVKRPLKSEFLDGRKPSYTLNGKAIRYDCYTL